MGTVCVYFQTNIYIIMENLYVKVGGIVILLHLYLHGKFDNLGVFSQTIHIIYSKTNL